MSSIPFLTPEELARYQRQIMMPEIAEEGQRKIQQAQILVAGLGGLGSIASFYLVAAGVGYLRIVDRDRVELANLNRQILHWTDDIGKPKIESAREKLCRLNPSCRVEACCEEITDHNVANLVKGCSLIVDGTDNLETRKVLNRASLRARIPFVFGGVEGFNGMISTFVPGESACLECLFAHIHPVKKNFGVVGPLPGVVASLQALEAIKLILGIQGILKDRLIRICGADMTFHTIHTRKNPYCEACNMTGATKND